MKRQVLLILFMIAIIFAFTCSEGPPTSSSTNVYKYTGYNAAGNKIISGLLTIEQDTAFVVTGNWHFVPIGNCTRVGPQLGTGNFVGSIDNHNTLQINLNPNIVDSNVFLDGELENGHYTGTWRYYGFPGLINHGTFEAHK